MAHCAAAAQHNTHNTAHTVPHDNLDCNVPRMDAHGRIGAPTSSARATRFDLADRSPKCEVGGRTGEGALSGGVATVVSRKLGAKICSKVRQTSKKPLKY